jgi:hypothetical protein
VDGDGDVRFRLRQRVALERPGRLRIEVLGLFDQTLAVLTTDGAQFALFRVEDRSFETGEVHPGLLWEQARLALTPDEAIDLLLGVPRPGRDFVALGAASTGNGSIRVELGPSGGPVRQRALFDADERLRAVELIRSDGRLVWRAQYGDYSDVDGRPFAHEILLEVAAGGTRAEISLRDVELDPELPPEIFLLRVPGAARGPG